MGTVLTLADASGGIGPVRHDAFHHDGGGEPLHAGQRGELLVPQHLVSGQAGGGHPDQVVGIAEQSFRVPDLRDAGQGALEFGDRGGVLASIVTCTSTSKPALVLLWLQASGRHPRSASGGGRNTPDRGPAR
jgi:hypothetical protein